MIAIAQLLGRFWGQIVNYLIGGIAAGYGAVVFYHAAVGAALLVFFGVINAAWSGLSFALSPDIQRAMSWFMPDNADFCLATIWGAAAARWMLDVTMTVVTTQATIAGSSGAAKLPAP